MPRLGARLVLSDYITILCGLRGSDARGGEARSMWSYQSILFLLQGSDALGGDQFYSSTLIEPALTMMGGPSYLIALVDPVLAEPYWRAQGGRGSFHFITATDPAFATGE